MTRKPIDTKPTIPSRLQRNWTPSRMLSSTERGVLGGTNTVWMESSEAITAR